MGRFLFEIRDERAQPRVPRIDGYQLARVAKRLGIVSLVLLERAPDNTRGAADALAVLERTHQQHPTDGDVLTALVSITSVNFRTVSIGVRGDRTITACSDGGGV